MEYVSRGDNRPTAPASAPKRGKHVDWAARTVRIELFIVIVGSALLLAVVSLYLALNGSTTTSEAKRVDNSKYQAVFLNGGATSGAVAYTTYFGHVTKMTNSYVVLNDVYYLTTSNGTEQATSPQLTKLGCQQLHSPTDEMVVNRTQVAFWENLQDSGKVVQAIKQFKQQNPNGPNCSATSSSTPTPTGTGTQNSTNTQNSGTSNTNR